MNTDANLNLPTPNINLIHPFDLESHTEGLDLFAEELPTQQYDFLPPNSLSTIGCECGLSTFFCYGCGLAVKTQS